MFSYSLLLSLVDDIFKDYQSLVHFFPGDAQGRREANGTLPAAQEQQSILEGKVDNMVAQLIIRLAGFLVLDKLHADHQSHPPYLSDTRKTGLNLC
jgi:hypothetical protein